MVSGCDRVGRTVAPTPADPGSNPAIGNFHGSFVYKNNCLGKTKINIQRLIGNCHILCSLSLARLSVTRFESKFHHFGKNSEVLGNFRRFVYFFFKKMGHSWPLFLYFSSFQYTVDSKQMFNI